MSSKESDSISHPLTRPPRHSFSVLSVSVVSPLRVSLAVATPRVSFPSPDRSFSVCPLRRQPESPTAQFRVWARPWKLVALHALTCGRALIRTPTTGGLPTLDSVDLSLLDARAQANAEKPLAHKNVAATLGMYVSVEPFREVSHAWLPKARCRWPSYRRLPATPTPCGHYRYRTSQSKQAFSTPCLWSLRSTILQ
jgi:hypothetical protein